MLEISMKLPSRPWDSRQNARKKRTVACQCKYIGFAFGRLWVLSRLPPTILTEFLFRVSLRYTRQMLRWLFQRRSKPLPVQFETEKTKVMKIVSFLKVHTYPGPITSPSQFRPTLLPVHFKTVKTKELTNFIKKIKLICFYR